jgi:hypothetical protein
MATSKEHKAVLARCYSTALARLRNKYDVEFHAILQQVYEENNVEVQKRSPRSEVLKKKIEDAQERLNARMGWNNSDI